MTSETKRHHAAAERVWRLLFRVLMASSGARMESLTRRGLTPNDARALWSLDAEEERPIGELAREWGCDPSNATYIIDRLEKAGLAERRLSPIDRRVKLIALTEAGVRTRSELEAEYHKPPPEILELDEADLLVLERALSKVHQNEQETK